MSDVKLLVNGAVYSGWKRIRVTRSLESIASAFDLEVSDRWSGQETPWPIKPEDACTVQLLGQTIVTGYVDKLHISQAATEHSLSVSGRDRTGQLVDCSAVLKNWEFLDKPLLDLVTEIAKPFGITVRMDDSVTNTKVSLAAGKGTGVKGAGSTGRLGGLKLPKPPKKFSIDPGESAFEVIDRVCRMFGVLPVSDAVGGLILTRAGTATVAAKLVEGQNVLAASADYDMSQRYRTYRVQAQHAGTETYYGENAASIKGESKDLSVKRSERILLIRPEQSATTEHAQNRAAWENKIRAARGDTVSVTVQGWETKPGAGIWPVNMLIPLDIPTLGVKGNMLITQTDFNLDDSGTTTRLSLKRPDAFLPEPVITLGSALWKEINNI